jgi:hypothetical protein
MSIGWSLFVGNEENQEGSSQDRGPEYAAEMPLTRLPISKRKNIIMFRISGECCNCPQTFYACRNLWLASDQVGATRLSTTLSKYAWFVDILMTHVTLLNTSRTRNLKGNLDRKNPNFQEYDKLRPLVSSCAVGDHVQSHQNTSQAPDILVAI